MTCTLNYANIDRRTRGPLENTRQHRKVPFTPIWLAIVLFVMMTEDSAYVAGICIYRISD